MEPDLASMNPMFGIIAANINDNDEHHHLVNRSASSTCSSITSVVTNEPITVSFRATAKKPLPPKMPPPKHDDHALHEAFDRARHEAAKRKEATHHIPHTNHYQPTLEPFSEATTNTSTQERGSQVPNKRRLTFSKKVPLNFRLSMKS
jgi:hypothetical protein